jgi:hypothetical protein
MTNDAYVRLEKIDLGLRNLYGYGNDPLPSLNLHEVSSFDDVLAWTRRVSTWLAAFGRRCHNYVLPVSVKKHVKGEWKEGWHNGTGKWTMVLKTDDASLFPEYERHIRLRGISGWVVGKSGPYMVDLSLPTSTSIRFEKPDWIALNQEHDKGVPIHCRIGRVLERTGNQSEISGLNSLFNASPFGEWTVSDSNGVSGDDELPEDFHLDLYLSVLTVPETKRL